MAIWKLKSCPRCIGGDLYIGRDNELWYAWCLQCGYDGDPSGTSRPEPPNADNDSISLRDLSAPSTEDYPPDFAPDYEIDIKADAISKV